MRRILIGLGVTVFTLLAFAGVASAAPGQVTQSTLRGAIASATWNSNPSATSSVTTVVNVDADELFAEQFTAYADSSGNFTGGIVIFVDVTSGFSFAIDRGQLTSASVSASGIPSTTCAVDANGNVSNCSLTTVDVTADWAGQGSVIREVCVDHFRFGGFSEIDHVSGAVRDANVTGTFSGTTLNTADLSQGALTFTNAKNVTLCIGKTCAAPPPMPPPCGF